MSLEYFMMISGIFSKNNDLDILPPPPPFPEIGKEEVGVNETRKKEKGEVSRKKEFKKKKIDKKKSQILSRIEDREIQKPEKKTMFGRIFGKKKVVTEFDKVLEKQSFSGRRKSKAFSSELGDLEKLEAPESRLLEIEKPVEIAKDEEEIERAIKVTKGVKKRPSIVKGWFKKKEPEEKVGIPEVMPRTYDKIDYVEEIEEKMHKARLALMDFKFEEVKSVYVEIMRMYNQLEPKKRSKVYQDIKDLYYERKSAEKFARR